MADFWQHQKNERKAELIKYWHQRGGAIVRRRTCDQEVASSGAAA